MCAAGIAAVVVLQERGGAPTGGGNAQAGAAVDGLPAIGEPIRLPAPEGLAAVPVTVDVHDPGAVMKLLASNPWAQQALEQPLGRGFLGSWAAFLSTSGEDLHAEFSALLPHRLPPIKIQRFSARRVGLTVVVGLVGLLLAGTAGPLLLNSPLP